MSDPNNDFVEPDESNNETDVKVTVAGNTVTAGRCVHPDTTPAPDHVGRAGRRRARARQRDAVRHRGAAGGGVQFVVDGNVVGAAATSSPYSMSWDSTTVVDGEHWVAARTTDAQGRTNTTAAVRR